MFEKEKSAKTILVDELHWRKLVELRPEEVSSRCRCDWDPGMGFKVEFLGEGYWVEPRSRQVVPCREEAPLEPYLPLVLVMFVLGASDIPLENRMVSEREIPGGELFFRHLHRLPGNVLEQTFGSRPQDLLEVAMELGASRLKTSSVSVKFLPLPRIPVALHLWPADEEFPAHCTFTFDASVHKQLPLDVIWALAQVLVQRILWADRCRLA